MKKICVNWEFTDIDGFSTGGCCNWFDTIEEANQFILEKKKGNGSYFRLCEEPFEAEYDNKIGYDKYPLLQQLKNEITELEEELNKLPNYYKM